MTAADQRCEGLWSHSLQMDSAQWMSSETRALKRWMTLSVMLLWGGDWPVREIYFLFLCWRSVTFISSSVSLNLTTCSSTSDLLSQKLHVYRDYRSESVSVHAHLLYLYCFTFYLIRFLIWSENVKIDPWILVLLYFTCTLNAENVFILSFRVKV